MNSLRKRFALIPVLCLALIMAFATLSVSADDGTGTGSIKASPVRFAGQNRYETSLLTADALKESLGVDQFDTVVIAYGGNYPDALAGGYLANIKNAPVITVDTITKNSASEKNVTEYLDKNLKTGGKVYILGGTSSVSASFENTLTTSGYDVTRLAGSNRIATNLEILKEVGTSDKGIIVATGYNYADALSVSAVDMPTLVLANKATTFTAEQEALLKEYNPSNVYIVGGTASVSSAIENTLSNDYGYNVKRIAGNNRYATSVAIAENFFDSDAIDGIVLAYGKNFPDGLSAGPLAASYDAPLILTETNDHAAAKAYRQSTSAYLCATVSGTSLISDAAVYDIMYNYVSVSDLYKNQGDYKIIDVRTEANYATSHMPGSYSADVAAAASAKDNTVAETVEKIKAVIENDSADTKYAIMCNTGNSLARIATQVLAAEGVDTSNIYTITGGWRQYAATYPKYVVKTYTSTGGTEFLNGITAENLKADVDGDKKLTVVDLRVASLYEAAHIPGAVSAVQRDVSDEEAKANLQAVVDDYPDAIYALICYSGNSFATKARNTLVNDLGIDEEKVVVLEGGQGAWTSAGYATKKSSSIKVDKEAGTVTFKATSNENFFTSDNPAIEHLITSSANNESQGGKALFDTDVTPLELYAALEKIGGTAWSSTSTAQFDKGQKLNDSDVKSKADSADYSKLEVEVYDGDTYLGELKDVLKYQKNGEEAIPNISMVFSGNKVNQTKWNTGCVACIMSCYAGITSNENIGIGTTNKSENYFYANQDVLQANHEYTFVYSINSTPDYNYVSQANTYDAIEDSNVVILDARKVKDYETAHIPGAVSASCDSVVSDNTLSARNDNGEASENINAIVSKYGTDKDYYIACYSGNRYAKAATELLVNAGVDNANIFIIEGGMTRWSSTYPNYLVKTYTSSGNFEFMNGITVENLKADVEGNQLYTVVDLRISSLYEEGHIPGSVSAVQRDVTDDEAEANLKAVVDNTAEGSKYVLVCYSGNRFANMARNTMVNSLGIDEKDILVLEGGFGAWSDAGYNLES